MIAVPFPRRRLMMAVIRLARRLFFNTPVQHWRVTSGIYRWAYRRASAGGDVTAEVHGVTMTFPANDITISPGLLGGFYEKLEIDAFVHLAARSRTILDVGGNLGLYACLGARELPADGRLVTFEPVPDNLAYLRRNLAQNSGGARVVVEESAVGAREDQITIHLSADSVGTHSASAANVARSTGQVTVPMTTIDAYVASHGLQSVDVLKVDVEGYDLAVLQGATETLRLGPSLLVEYGVSQLRNCGADPHELVRLVCDAYEHVLLIDEVRQRVRRCSRHELERLSERRVTYNLICVRRAEHLVALAAHEPTRCIA
ncbi:MAG: FkbM family methyltransferase [Chloroflexi bacterium]|nr:FkbM family methyltransferase [Chloroflexota bacterium]